MLGPTTKGIGILLIDQPPPHSPLRAQLLSAYLQLPNLSQVHSCVQGCISDFKVFIVFVALGLPFPQVISVCLGGGGGGGRVNRLTV